MIHPIHAALLVGSGGAIGSLLRYALGLCFSGSHAMAWGVGVANLLGSLLAGVVLALDVPEAWRIFAVVGVLGGFTTFSSYSLVILGYGQQGSIGLAAGYALVSVGLAIGCIYGGYTVTKGLIT